MSIQNVIFVLDSRQRNAGGTINNATYNMVAAGGVQAGTYEMLSYHSQNQFFNVELNVNDQLRWDENGTADVTAVLAPGFYTAATLATEIDAVMTAASVAADANTYVTTHNATTGKYSTTSGGGSTWRYDWLTASATETNLANELLGYSLVDPALANVQVSDRQITLTLHSQLIIDIAEDSQQNVTLLSGAEHSLIVPLDQDFQTEIDSLKNNVFSQTIRFGATLNSLNVQLFTEDGVAPVNLTEYELTIRRLF